VASDKHRVVTAEDKVA